MSGLDLAQRARETELLDEGVSPDEARRSLADLRLVNRLPGGRGRLFRAVRPFLEGTDRPRLLDVGFASEHWLFLWTPVLLVSVAGLLMLCRRDPVAGAGLLAAFASTYYVVSCYEAWHGISSFGNRFFVGLTPAFVVGAAVALQGAHALLAPRLSTAGASIALALSVALLAAWNAGLVFQWGTSMVPRQGPVDFALVARNQVTAVPRRIRTAMFVVGLALPQAGLTAATMVALYLYDWLHVPLR